MKHDPIIEDRRDKEKQSKRLIRRAETRSLVTTGDPMGNRNGRDRPKSFWADIWKGDQLKSCGNKWHGEITGETALDAGWQTDVPIGHLTR